jgi:hypothetical protein
MDVLFIILWFFIVATCRLHAVLKFNFKNTIIVQEPRVISRPVEEREAGPFNEILRREVKSFSLLYSVVNHVNILFYSFGGRNL